MSLSPEKIRQSIKALLELQTIDGQIFKLRSDEKSLPPQVAELQAKLEEARKAQRLADKAFKEIDRERRSLELRNLTFQEDLKRSETRKRELRNTKEEFGATKDFENLQRKMQEMTKALEEKQKIAAERQAALEQKVKILEELELAWKTSIDSEKARVLGIQESIAQLETTRAAHISLVEEEVFGIYERVQRIRRGNGIAIVNNLLCGGCFVAVPPQLAIQLEKMEQILTCPSCSRILCPSEIEGTESQESRASA